MAEQKWYIHPVIAVGVLMNIFVMGLALAFSHDHDAMWRLLVEDGIVEWMQFLCFTLLSALLGFLAVEQWQREPKINLQLLAFVFLSALVGLAALEEISWFQRVLHIIPPDFFLHNNRQGETNLHNLALGKSSLHKAVLLKVIVIVGLTHTIFLPLLARKRPGIRTFVEKFGLYLPPLSASVIYVVLVILSNVLVDHPRKGELGETFGAVHYLTTVVAAYFFGVGYGKKPVFSPSADARNIATLFCLVLIFMLLIGWMLSAGAGAGAYIASHPGFGAE